MSNTTTTAQRLERVRGLAGCKDLRSFWRAVTGPDEEGEGFSISYDAVRTYHLQDREPPASYLARVARLFDVRLEWLVTGDPPMATADEELARVGALVSETTEEELEALPEPARRIVRMDRAASRTKAALNARGVPAQAAQAVVDLLLAASAHRGAPEPDPEPFLAFVEEHFPTPLALCERGASFGEKTSAFLTTASVLYLQLFGSNPAKEAHNG